MVQIIQQRREFISPKQFGAYGDTRSLSNTSITSGTSIVTNTVDAPFKKSDIGAYINLISAGASSQPHGATVTGFTSATEITISINATVTMTNGRCVIGHDDTDALTKALDYIAPKPGYTGGSNLYLGDGHYLTGPLTLPTGCGIFGNGPFQSMLYLKPGSATTNKYLLRNRTSNANRQSYEDFGLNGLRDFQRVGGLLLEDVNTLQWSTDPDNLAVWEGSVFNRYRNLFITESCRAGLKYQGPGDSKFSDITILKSGYGFDINSPNNSFTGCAASAYGAAWLLGSATKSNRFSACKGYFSGYSPISTASGSGETANWFLNGASNNDFTACEGQESWGSNWVLVDAKRNSFSSCRGADPGCLYLAHSLGSNNSAVIRAGWLLMGDTTNNRFAACSAGVNAHDSTTYGSHGVYLSGSGTANVGDIYLDSWAEWTTGNFENLMTSRTNTLRINGFSLNVQNYWKTSSNNFTAMNGDRIMCDTSAGSFTITLPATPSFGTEITLKDKVGTWGISNLIVDRNGSTIDSLAENLVCDINSAEISLLYNGSTWII